MAVSARSSSFRSTPGYVARPTVSAAFPAPQTTVPAIPTLPAIDDARAPNAAGRSWLQTVLTNLPGKYAGALTGARESARAALSGYGGVIFQDDNPATPEREDLLISFDPNAKLGQREKNAVDNDRNQANAAGMMASSFANKQIGATLTRLNEEKRAIVNNFAQQINSALTAMASEGTSLVTEFTRLYGEDSRWLADNPPPTPPPAPVNEGDASGGRSQTAPPGPSGPNRAGNIVTSYRAGDVSPGLLSSLALQYPGYKAVRSGDGRLVLKKMP